MKTSNLKAILGAGKNKNHNNTSKNQDHSNTNQKETVNLSHYKHVDDPGWYIHKETNKKFCGKCIHPPISLESPLSVYKGTKDWHCIRCGEKYVPKDGGDSLFLDEEQI